jgi:hypothetical protein
MFAPASPDRARVVPRTGSTAANQAGECGEAATGDRQRSLAWAQRLKRVFAIDIETCCRYRRCRTPVDNTVDVEQATYTNSIGDALPAAYREDPDFDPAQSACYYVRVLEIPTSSWLVYDRKTYGLEIPKEAVLKQQERAYTSPIWYTA